MVIRPYNFCFFFGLLYNEKLPVILWYFLDFHFKYKNRKIER